MRLKDVNKKKQKKEYEKPEKKMIKDYKKKEKNMKINKKN